VPEQTASTAGKNDSAPPNAARVWPADVPSEVDAEAILCAACDGLKAAEDAALDAALGALTELEKRALDGVPQGFDPAPLRRAATLRYRISTAVATAPAPGAPIDGAAGRALLAEIDEVLGAVAPLATSARAAEADAIRHALVKEAVDFSELLQRLTMPEAAAMPAALSGKADEPRTRTSVPATRVVVPATAGEDRGSRGGWIALAVVALLVGAWHGQRLLGRPAPAPRPTVDGAPDGAFGYRAADGSRVVISATGKPMPPAQADAFREREAAAGRTVREVAPGVFVSAPSIRKDSP
jgi:hypothetical protein